MTSLYASSHIHKLVIEGERTSRSKDQVTAPIHTPNHQRHV